MLDAISTILNQIGEGIVVGIKIIIMVISRIWAYSVDFFGGGLWGQIFTLTWMLGGVLVVGIVLFVYSINKTQSGIELFSASTMGKFLIAFVAVAIFIILVYITYPD